MQRILHVAISYIHSPILKNSIKKILSFQENHNGTGNWQGFVKEIVRTLNFSRKYAHIFLTQSWDKSATPQ